MPLRFMYPKRACGVVEILFAMLKWGGSLPPTLVTAKIRAASAAVAAASDTLG